MDSNSDQLSDAREHGARRPRPWGSAAVRALAVGLAATVLVAVNAWAAKPRLVVQITIDQLRGDMPLRFKDRFGEGGFRYLMENGVVYTGAHYQHSTCREAL